MINPYEAPRASLDAPEAQAGDLVCPYCGHQFALTWKRYLKAPFGGYICPSCDRKSRLRAGPVYWLLYLPALAIVNIFAPFLSLVVLILVVPKDTDEVIDWLFAGQWGLVFLVTFWVLLQLVVAIVDRQIDKRFRKLRPLKEANAV